MGSRTLGAERPMALALAGAACISSSSVLIVLAHVGAATAAFYRCVLALPLLIVLALLEQKKRGRRPRQARVRAFVAGTAFAVDLVLWNHSIAAVGAGVATVLGNLQVIFVAVAAWIVFKERPSGRFAMTLPVVAIGVVLVAGIIGGSQFGPDPVAGILYGVGTSVAYAVFLLMMKSASSHTPHVAGPLTDATLGAALSVLVLGAIFGTFSWSLPLASLGWLALLALASQVVGWMLITSSLPHLPSAMSSLLLLVQPALSMLLAAVVLSQYPTGWQVLGAALVCCGVLFAAWRSGTRAAEVEGGGLPGTQSPRGQEAAAGLM